MSTRPDLDLRINAWLDSQAPMREPDGLFDRVAADLAHTHRLPGWVIPERWLPMQTTARLGTASRAAITLALAALLLAAFAVIVVAAQPKPAPSTGVARNGLIAFPNDHDMWVVEPDGSNPRPLVATPNLELSGVWSPDGTQLAFWSLQFDGDVNLPAAVDAAFAVPDGKVLLTVVDSDGSDPRVLTSGMTWVDDCGTDLSWAHDSSRLAISYTDLVDGQLVPVIDILSLGGEAPRRLVEGGTDPYWSPDDRTIAYHGNPHVGSDGEGDGQGVWLIGADGADDRRLSQAPGAGCAFDGPGWSSDGERIAFYANADGLHDIWVANVDGSGETAIAKGPGDQYWPRWSPDGTRIAFDDVVDTDNNAPQFVISDPDGSNQRMLDHPMVAARYPTWSPDGGSVLGMLLDDSHKEVVGLLVVDPDGVDEPVELYRGSVTGDPSWQRLAP